jgi:hypothetical protein
MKRFGQFNLTKESIVLFTFGVIILLYFALPDYYRTLNVQAQLQQQQPPSPTISVKITSPSRGQQVPTGELTISEISSDNATSDCTVYADWNNTKPFQKAIATGTGGVNDYSKWTFTYTDKYHLITNGTNNLTSKLSCFNDNNGSNIGTAANVTKSYSVNVIGVIGSQRPVSSVAEQQSNLSSGITSSLSSVKEDNNTETTTTTTTIGPESIPSVPITPSSEPEGNEDTITYWDIQ